MYCYKEVVPFCAMMAVQCTTVVVNVLFKAATLKGLSYYVFIVYSFAFSALVLLLPLPFILRCSRGLPPFIVFLLYIIFLLRVVGSPTLASAPSTLTLAFTFIFAVSQVPIVFLGLVLQSRRRRL